MFFSGLDSTSSWFASDATASSDVAGKTRSSTTVRSGVLAGVNGVAGGASGNDRDDDDGDGGVGGSDDDDGRGWYLFGSAVGGAT